MSTARTVFSEVSSTCNVCDDLHRLHYPTQCDMTAVCILMQLNIAFPATGAQKKVEIDDDSKL